MLNCRFWQYHNLSKFKSNFAWFLKTVKTRVGQIFTLQWFQTVVFLFISYSFLFAKSFKRKLQFLFINQIPIKILDMISHIAYHIVLTLNVDRQYCILCVRPTMHKSWFEKYVAIWLTRPNCWCLFHCEEPKKYLPL